MWKENDSLGRKSSLDGNDLPVQRYTYMSIESNADGIATENNVANIPANQEIAKISVVADDEQNAQFIRVENVTDVNFYVWLD